MTRDTYRALNPALHRALGAVCGKVETYRGGEVASYDVANRTALDDGAGAVYPSNVKGGERYVAKCPFCGRRKLWVSYLAGAAMATEAGQLSFSRGYVICYRCLFNKDETRMRIFWDRLSAAGYGREARALRMAGPGRPVYPSEYPQPPAAVALPPNVPLAQAPPRALEYLAGRGIDPADLGRRLGAVWSDHPRGITDPVGRVLFPIWQNRTLVGWQGRALDADVEGTRHPKYLFPAGCSKERWLYNLDVARWRPVGVLVEGVLDVYRVGDAGLGRFGKVFHPPQVKLLADIWGGRGVVVIPDANEKPGKDKSALDIAIEAVDDWNLRGLFKDGARLCPLPKGKDPGSCTHEELVRLVKEKTGVDIT